VIFTILPRNNPEEKASLSGHPETAAEPKATVATNKPCQDA